MRLYSWNLWFSNPNLDDALAFIRDTEFDVFCLQEVPEPLLEQLRQLPYEIAYAPEIDRLFKGTVTTQYLVTLSRFPIRLTRAVPLESHEALIPWYGSLFVTLMRALGLWGWGQGNRHALVADLALPSGNTRVVNVHLPLIAPRARIEEFELLMKHTDGSAPRIICGDFNVIESLRMAVLNWLFGANARDAVRYTRERFEIENRFVQYELVNPLRGRSTHPISRSQLDHILLSPHFAIADATVLANRHGSDHHPIFVKADWTA